MKGDFAQAKVVSLRFALSAADGGAAIRGSFEWRNSVGVFVFVVFSVTISVNFYNYDFRLKPW